jgi:ATP-dependent Clp protease ATP-binding subunit ClpA
MFERYTESARRVIFFARHEASQFGSTRIETEHLLLGLIREDKDIISRFIHAQSSAESIRIDIEARTAVRGKVSATIDLPLTNECKRILAYAAEEAERLNHRHIGTEHLLLGILHEENCLAATILHERGLRLNVIREELANSPAAVDVGTAAASQIDASPNDAVVPDGETAKRIATAIWLAAYGGKTAGGDMTVEIIQSNVWRVTAGPLFAFINASDAKVRAIGMSKVGSASV